MQALIYMATYTGWYLALLIAYSLGVLVYFPESRGLYKVNQYLRPNARGDS